MFGNEVEHIGCTKEEYKVLEQKWTKRLLEKGYLVKNNKFIFPEGDEDNMNRIMVMLTFFMGFFDYQCLIHPIII